MFVRIPSHKQETNETKKKISCRTAEVQLGFDFDNEMMISEFDSFTYLA